MMEEKNEALVEHSSNFEHSFEPKPLITLEKRDIIFCVLAAVICIFTAVCGIFGGFTIGFTLSVLLLTVLFAV